MKGKNYLLGIALSLTLISCLPDQTTITKEQALTGVAGTLAVKEAVDVIKDNAPKFQAYLQVKDKEVCHFIDDQGTTLGCHLIACEEEDDSLCMREVLAQEVDRNKIAFISIDALQELFASVEVFCLKNETNCEIIGSNYEDIDKVFLVKEIE